MRTTFLLGCITTLMCGTHGLAQGLSDPALTPPRVTQAMITSGNLDLNTIRTHGLRMFASPFNRRDGYGDGPADPMSPTVPGHRPTLQNNGTFLRVNGLDAQTCQECHSVLSFAEVPFKTGIGGVGGSNNNVLFQPTLIDVADGAANGFAAFNGRYINPPFLFGAGGIQLAAKEMTAELQALKAQAQNNPGTSVCLTTKGVHFGYITYQNGSFDTSAVVGINEDLVVRPFGRKGEFPTTRAFDVDAMMFHFGMQPDEAVGVGVDDDGDGVANEVLVGEMSALAIFGTTLERPVEEDRSGFEQAGFNRFQNIGCADCHRPALETNSRWLTYSFPEVPEDPYANIFYSVRLDRRPTRFEQNSQGGVTVPLFSDLKRHDMGPGLAESFGSTLDSQFITARLWGVADTAPYLHDGRALTLEEAILAHGGEAQSARDAFANLSFNQQRQLIAFLKTLRTPDNPGRGLNVKDL